ncbi:hypothetical protein CAF53_03225 [Sphingobium sp. LB126]|uniref:HpcH/HpaI aldolase family protein n=1 Tax=Sphingobium sp. LB126 TaxID=1983755 RepID=UPI000C204DA1|nr:aldolase/citrate lyase family protein [Sphingobium sp. LB126]PJG47359.1 hypothetical protein CAF53_03225 [Sphingobium sp. LB126]
MERPAYIRQSVINGAPLIGTWVSLPAPAIVELVGDAGYDFITIEGEHAAFGRSQIEDMVRAADAAGIPSIVRVPMEGNWISTALDAGTGGIMIPHVENADEARAIVKAARFPPMGDRGVGAGRASRYGMNIGPYLQGANDGILVALMIESVEGVRNAREIASVPGVDVLFIGTGDLGLSIAHSADAGFDIDGAIGQVVEACQSVGCAVGMMATDLTIFAKWKARGMSFMMVGLDVMILGAALKQLERDARAIG